MLRSVIHNVAFGLPYVKMLVADIEADAMCRQVGGIRNHPAWTLGHMATALDFAAQMLELPSEVPEEWTPLCGRGSTPTEDASQYPSKEEFLAVLDREQGRILDALQKLDSGALAQPTPDEEFRELMPTLGDALVFILAMHQAIHVGELCAWRQAAGLPMVMA